MKKQKIRALSKYINPVLFLCLFLAWPVSASANDGVVVDEVLGIVGNRPILLSDVENQYISMQAQGYTFERDPKCEIFEELLLQNLMINQAEIDSVEVGENEVINYLDQRLNYLIAQIGSREKLEEYFNKPMLQIKEELKEDIRNQLIAQRMQSTLTTDIKVNPSDIRRYYSQLSEDSLPLVEAQYEVAQIVMNPEVRQEEIDNVKARLREFQERINKGEDFATLAVLYSEDPGSASRGGELGFMPRSQLVPEFAAVAYNLKDKNKVSKIVQTEYGYHIIQLIDRQGERINVRHILLTPDVSPADLQLSRNRLDSVRNLILQESYTFEQAAFTFSGDEKTKNNGGTLVNPQTNTNKFEITTLPPKIAQVVNEMEVGEVSQPFLDVNERGQQVFKIVKLVNETEPHKANLNQDYQLFVNMLTNRKREQKVKDWIIDKQQTTYIRIDDSFRNCEYQYLGWIK